jgi:hypothetical protein
MNMGFFWFGKGEAIVVSQKHEDDDLLSSNSQASCSLLSLSGLVGS